MNKNDLNRLDEILVLTQNELYSKLRRMFKNSAVYRNGGYILVPGSAPIMLVAHLDTVHKQPVQQICKTKDGTILMSPQGIGGDDRCGIFSLLTIRRESQNAPWLLFTCDEETGCIGAKKFCDDHKANKLPKELDDLKLLIEIDRKGENDAVYYDCANAEFEAYIRSKGFQTEWGSFSDISLVAPELGVAAVNLSSGYYNAHTLHEYINIKHLHETIRRVKEIIEDAADPSFPKYEYMEAYKEPVVRSLGKGWSDFDFYRKSYGVDLAGVPAEYYDEYCDLLDYYTPSELDELRAESGDSIIHMLWAEEFCYYDESAEYDEQAAK